jgi:glycosyltransferase involved in cell wall biosynthesis
VEEPKDIDGKPAALMLAPEAPYPVAGGGALRTASLLEYLSRRYTVDLIVFRQPGAENPAGLIPPGKVRRVVVLDLPKNGRSVAARALRNAARVARKTPPLVDRFSGFDERIREAVAGWKYETGVIEHFWCAPYWEALAPVCRRTILNLHNIESVLHSRCAETDGSVAGVAHRAFYTACRRMEELWLPRFSEVLAASFKDAATVLEIASEAHVRVYPNAIPRQPAPELVEEDAIVFSGNMEYHPNFSGVRFFRKEVWPRLRERWPGLAWRLLGKNPSEVRQFTSGDDRIQVIGTVEDAVRELARSKVAVVPLLVGSGTRFKILEAWAARVPVVSTSIGAEGLPVHDGEDILLADTAEDFAEAVSRLLESPELRRRLARAGRALMEQEFVWETAWKDLDF